MRRGRDELVRTNRAQAHTVDKYRRMCERAAESAVRAMSEVQDAGFEDI
jgi:hypothetical protein